MKRQLLLVLFCGLAVMSAAQEKKSISRWQFHSLNSGGLLEGQTTSSYQLQSINGLQYRSWFAGLGVGLDFYRYRTIPLFLDIRKEFGKKANKIFLYADGGLNVCWVTDNEKTYTTDDHFSRGFYGDFGAGYKIRMGGRNALLLCLGYNHKQLSESYPAPYFYYIDIIQPNNSHSIKTNYSLNRLSIKLGWSF